MQRWTVLVSILLAAGACSAPLPTTPSVTELSSPAMTGSLAPNLSVAPDGRVLLSWLEPVSSKEYALRFSFRENQGWSAPRTITSGNDWFVSGADYPSVTFMPDGTMAANSLIATNLQAEAYNTNVYLSRDSGATWSEPSPLHRDSKQRQHGFVSFVPSGGGLGAVWLDGRNLSEEGVGDMSLLFTTIAKDGTMAPEAVLDSRVCECCQTSAAATSEGLIVVYRDRSQKEIRDIAAVRFVDGKWSTPVPVSTEGWEIDACPVNGPAVTANGKNVVAAWWTMAQDKPRVYAAFSTDAGRTFGKPVKVDDGSPQGNVDVALLASGAAAVSWVEKANEKRQLRLRKVQPDGTVGDALTISGNDGLDYGAFPRIKRSANDIVVTWTADGEKSSVRTAAVTLP